MHPTLPTFVAAAGGGDSFKRAQALACPGSFPSRPVAESRKREGHGAEGLECERPSPLCILAGVPTLVVSIAISLALLSGASAPVAGPGCRDLKNLAPPGTSEETSPFSSREVRLGQRRTPRPRAGQRKPTTPPRRTGEGQERAHRSHGGIQGEPREVAGPLRGGLAAGDPPPTNSRGFLRNR